jgi:hypothetical protein
MASAASERSVGETDGGCFSDSAFGTSAPAAHVLCTKTHATALQDVNAFSAARIRQRKLQCDAAVLSIPGCTHLLAPLTHLRCARRRMRVSTVFGMLVSRGALERYAGAHPMLCNARKCPFPSDLSVFRAQFRRLPRRLCRASRQLAGGSPEVRPPAGPADRCAFRALRREQFPLAGLL